MVRHKKLSRPERDDAGKPRPVYSELTTSGENPDRVYEVAHVVWLDIEDRTSQQWVSWDEAIEDATRPFQPILTAGVVLHEDEMRLVLSPSVGSEETAGALTLPKSVIISDVRYTVTVRGLPLPPESHQEGEA